MFRFQRSDSRVVTAMYQKQKGYGRADERGQERFVLSLISVSNLSSEREQLRHYF
jgi:hypothetical protein